MKKHDHYNDSDYNEDTQYFDKDYFDQPSQSMNDWQDSASSYPYNTYDHQYEEMHSEEQLEESFQHPLYSDADESFANQDQPIGQRSRYHVKIDKFLNNGIIIVGVLLILVLLIAFLI